MAKNGPLGDELGLVGPALSNAFSARVLAWQLGGTMVAALVIFLLVELPGRVDRGVGFVLTGLALVLVYVILAATGCILMRMLGAGGEDKEESGTAALHFLIDHVGTALLLPLIVAAGAFALAGVLCAPAALWAYGTWASILAIPWLLVFVLAALVLADLFILLFLVPAMVTTEQPPFGDALRRLWRLAWAGRCMDILKLFGVGLVIAIALAVPLSLLALASVSVITYVHATVGGANATSFAGFVLRLGTWLLILAPVATLPLAFLNCLAAGAYGGLVEGLESDEEEAEEEPDLEVEDEKEAKKK